MAGRTLSLNFSAYLTRGGENALDAPFAASVRLRLFGRDCLGKPERRSSSASSYSSYPVRFVGCYVLPRGEHDPGFNTAASNTRQGLTPA
jgi:hypothetical protein